MKSAKRPFPTLLVHGGAGARAASLDRLARRQGILKAARCGVEILNQGGPALDAVVTIVKALEDDPLFNAGYGSVLTAEGSVEMDAGLMTFTPADAAVPAGPRSGNRAEESARPSGATIARGRRQKFAAALAGGAVAAVSRVRNPILLARAVMELTPHLLMTGAGALRLARRARLQLCRPSDLITPRARARWRSSLDRQLSNGGANEYGTVGAVALDLQGRIAAATSTGGVTGKMAGRVGDSAIIGAGVFVSEAGGSSATGQGEAIIQSGLCREAVSYVSRSSALAAARRAVATLARTTRGEAGLIVLDRRGGLGYAHNAESMQIAVFDEPGGLRQLWVEPMRL